MVHGRGIQPSPPLPIRCCCRPPFPARLLRTNAPMASETPVQGGDLQSQVRALMELLNYKQCTIAKEVGTNRGNLSRWLQRKIDRPSIESKLRTWVATKTRKLGQGHIAGAAAPATLGAGSQTLGARRASQHDHGELPKDRRPGGECGSTLLLLPLFFLPLFFLCSF